MNINVELKNINYTNKRNYIDLSNLNLTNELVEPLFEVFPETETLKKIDITSNEGIVDLIINSILDKGYLVIYDEGQCIIENTEENKPSEDNNQNNENTENNNSDNEQNNESEENINGNNTNNSNENNG